MEKINFIRSTEQRADKVLARILTIDKALSQGFFNRKNELLLAHELEFLEAELETLEAVIDSLPIKQLNAPLTARR